MINIGLIGLGRIGKIHFYNSMRLKNARLVAVADTSKKTRSLAKAEGIKEVYDDYEKLLRNPAVDCVIISVPTFLHAECAIEAAEHGKHVFIEKPLARNVREGKEIISHGKLNQVKIMVGYPIRFSSLFSELKSKVHNGVLGDIVTAHATSISSGPFTHRTEEAVPSPVPSWWFDKTLTGGGALLDMGSHMINLLRWYFGDNISSVKSLLGHRFNMEFEDHAICLIKFENGPTAIVNVGWFSLEQVVGIELFGTAKNASTNKLSKSTLRRVVNVLMKKSPQAITSFYRELEYFVNCIEHDLSPSPSAEDGLKDLEIISLAYKNEIS